MDEKANLEQQQVAAEVAQREAEERFLKAEEQRRNAKVPVCLLGCDPAGSATSACALLANLWGPGEVYRKKAKNKNKNFLEMFVTWAIKPHCQL